MSEFNGFPEVGDVVEFRPPRMDEHTRKTNHTGFVARIARGGRLGRGRRRGLPENALEGPAWRRGVSRMAEPVRRRSEV